MSPSKEAAVDKANILVVDDLPEKLLVFRTVLEDLHQNLVFVRSGSEALREVLQREFAVILLDVNMPDIDGFETATLIRRYKRSAHTPIIFITAYADELQTSRGYSLGAVDYILSPVVPDILRSKVRVFVELHALQRRIAQQADERVALAASAAALQVAEESTRRSACLSDLSHALSGLLDVRAGLHKLLGMVVPQLCTQASVVLFDEQQRPHRAARRGSGDLAAVDVDPAALSERERARLAAGGEHVHLLRSGEHPLGALLIDGPPTPLGAAVLEEVANRAAIAFATAQLYQNLQDEIAERRRAEVRLEEANRRKDEFLAMLSHELRNPLSPIANAVEVIRRIGGHDPKLRWATDITDRQVRQLTRLVDELLDVARISQGKIVLQKSPVDLGVLISQCIELQRPLLAARQQSLTQALPPQPVWVLGDGARLQQVISNLLSNATKYTQNGGNLHIGLTVEQGRAMVIVRDNGMGIEPELLPRVFELFEQGQRALDRNQGGLGVGLTLVQRLVRLHGGHVEAFSAGAGRGAEFRVFLPCLQAVEDLPAADAPAAADALPRRRILLVEDNVDVADTTALMLTMSGHTVRVSRDGMAALSCVAEFAPEIVLLDIGLPLLDGYEVARRMRAMPALKRTRIVALTGYGQPADRRRGREAGFDEHVLKPVDPAALAALIDRGPLSDEEAQAADPAPESEAAPAPGQATLYSFKRP
ncbi:hybrid sensor histidine kinase/response regulator [Pseudaquabacterium terrae]|uniref:hybrid sensor histidine kinase/response regulator n=1 Tax=Pseudaquabacterium terrae TaxID=2732868 RepID=UPI001FE7C564|nr:response regulator [Aquabacterium terrae]